MAINKRGIIAIALFFSILIVLITVYQFIPSYTVWLSPVRCEYLFGVSPEEFMNTKFEFYSETGDLRKNARISEDGLLIINLSQYQKYAWKKTEWLSDFSKYPHKDPFVISSDYKKVEVYIPYGLNANGDEYQNILDEAHIIFSKMCMLQLCDGIPAEYIYVEYIVRDEANGEILYSEFMKGFSGE